MVRVVICDDHEMVREALAVVLGAFDGLEVVGTAESSASLVDTVQLTDPDVIVVDVRLGDESGLDAARRARALNSRLKVMMLTSFASDQVVVEAHELGAVAFLLKSGRPHEIADAIRAVAAGAVLLDVADVESARQRLADQRMND